MAKSFIEGFNSVFTRKRMFLLGVVWTITGAAAMFIPALGMRIFAGFIIISGLAISLLCHFKVGKGIIYSGR